MLNPIFFPITFCSGEKSVVLMYNDVDMMISVNEVYFCAA